MFRYRKLLLIVNRAVYVIAAAMLIAGLVLTVSPTPVQAGSGAIWTTSGGCSKDPQQDVNQYNVGDWVYINGSNFPVSTSQDWTITGQPGGASSDPNIVVASGLTTVDSTGYLCVKAYQVQPGDRGTYTVDITGANKNDNYRVGEEATPTDPTPTDPTPTDPTPTDPTPTDPTPTDPTPTDPTPTDPTPTDPTPTDPTPTDPTPTDPTPTDPTPTDPTPTDPTPTDPTPTDPTPTDPTPTDPTPTDPTPTDPTPTDPTPTDATPTDPGTGGPDPTFAPPPQSVAASAVLIPVTGMDVTPGMNSLSYGGLGMLGFGLVLSGIRRKLDE